MQDAPEDRTPAWFSNSRTCRVDFNCIDHGLVKAGCGRMQGGIPQLGERVFLHDYEGNRCWGRLERVEGALAYFDIDDATWVSGPETVTVRY